MTHGYNPPPTMSSTQTTIEMHHTASKALDHLLLSIVVPIYNERATIEEIIAVPGRAATGALLLALCG